MQLLNECDGWVNGNCTVGAGWARCGLRTPWCPATCRDGGHVKAFESSGTRGTERCDADRLVWHSSSQMGPETYGK